MRSANTVRGALAAVAVCIVAAGMTDPAPAGEPARALGHLAPSGFSAEEIAAAVLDLTGRDLSAELRHTESYQAPFKRRDKYEVLGTREAFSFYDGDCRVAHWELGDYKPPIVESTPAAYERRFMELYWPEGCDTEMLLLTAPDFRTRAYSCLLPSGVVGGGGCTFDWDGSFARLVGFSFMPCSDASTIPTPRIDYQEAIRRAVQFVTKWPGSPVPEPGPLGPLVSEDAARRPWAMVDDLGAQRASYGFALKLHWSTAPENREEGGAHDSGARPDMAMVQVDAVTGECFAGFVRSIWPPDVTSDHLFLFVREKAGAWEELCEAYYAPRLREGHACFCASYLGTKLWPDGALQVDRVGGRFAATCAGRTWQGKVGQRDIRCGEDTFRSEGEARSIEGNLYLPDDMVEKITGWHLSLVDHPDLGRSALLTAPE